MTHNQTYANRREILQELAALETTYASNMRTVCNSYLLPLKESKVLTDEEIASIFRSISDIRGVHGKLSTIIQNATTNANLLNSIESIVNEYIVARAALLELYVPYARGHSLGIKTLQRASLRADVSRVFSAVVAADERVKGESIEYFLILPLQHIIKTYDLLNALKGLSAGDEKYMESLTNVLKALYAILQETQEGGYVVSSSYFVQQGNNGNELVKSPRPPTRAPPAPTLTASSTANIISSAILGLGLPSLPSVLKKSDVTVDKVLQAQRESELATLKLEALEREVALKERDLVETQLRAKRIESEMEPNDSAVAKRAETSQQNPEEAVATLDAFLHQLSNEEKALYKRMQAATPEQRAIFEAFLVRKAELDAEEARLLSALEEHEEALAQVRSRLANPPANILPSDPAKAAMYIAWKRALMERDELLRQARIKKHTILRDLRTRFETQLVLLELEKRNSLLVLQNSVNEERAKVEKTRAEIAALDASIDDARNAMKKFRQEFEQLRLALVVDRMAKNTQISSLEERKQKLEAEASEFSQAIEAARQRVVLQETAKWEAILAKEKEDAERRIAAEKELVESKIARVRAVLADRYESGFKPLLEEAENKYQTELQRVATLQDELQRAERELQDAHEAARHVSADIPKELSSNTPTNTEVNAADMVDPVTGQPVPAWKVAEFEELKLAIIRLWDTLDIPPEEITAFLSEVDLMAPFSPQVLEMYNDMYKRLSGALPAIPDLPDAPNQSSLFKLQDRPSQSPAVSTSHSTIVFSPEAMRSSSNSRAFASDLNSTNKSNVQPLQTRNVPVERPAASIKDGASAAAPIYSTPERSRSTTLAANSSNRSKFRNTIIGAKKSNVDDDDEIYIQKLTQRPLPPSLGGPGGRRALSPPLKR